MTSPPRRGHATMMAEVAASLGPGVKPGAVLLSVGGGGLLCGVVQGLEDVGWVDVPIIAMETVGADCFNAAVKAGRLVTLDDITRSGSKVRCLILVGFPDAAGPTSCFLLVPQRGQMSRSQDGLPESFRTQPTQRPVNHLGTGDRSAGSARRPGIPG